MNSGIISFPGVMDIYDVKELFSRYYVDSDVARQKVPSPWTVKIHENGKALLLVMVQEYKKMVLDYLIKVKSMGMSHVWIELNGPPEIVAPLPGTTRSLPTWYWYIFAACARWRFDSNTVWPRRCRRPPGQEDIS